MIPDGNQPNPRQGQAFLWVERQQLPLFPMGKIDRQIARQLLNEEVDP
jgi:hypothetical protein